MPAPVAAFTSALPLLHLCRDPQSQRRTRRRRRPHHSQRLYTSRRLPQASLPFNPPNRDEDEPPIFVASPPSPFSPSSLDDISLAAPLSEEERAAVRARLPGPVADFLIRRADEALLSSEEIDVEVGVASESARPQDSRAATAAARRSARARKWVLGDNISQDREFDDEAWYRDYVWDEIGEGLDEFGRQRIVEDGAEEETGSKEEGEGDVYAPRPVLPDTGFPGEENVNGGRRTVPLFAGVPGGRGAQQSQQVTYGVMAFLVALVLLKVVLAFVQFFVSFTFSFLAIFALSAGIFVFFFLLRF